jgi:hypothetical protein
VSDLERKGSNPPEEPPRGRWGRRVRRLRNEAALYLVRGAATAVGGAFVSLGLLWTQSRF